MCTVIVSGPVLRLSGSTVLSPLIEDEADSPSKEFLYLHNCRRDIHELASLKHALTRTDLN